MIWTLLLIVAGIAIGWRFGAGVLAAVLAAVWVAGVAGLWHRHSGGRPLLPSDLWVPAIGIAALGAAYAAMIGWLRSRARKASDGDADITPQHPPAVTASTDSTDSAVTSVAIPSDPSQPLSDAELDRYARHIVLRELGGAGQRRLRAARVLVVGAGGLGAPALMYLAAAGVGRITVADDDTVGLSNLQRQVIFATDDVGRPKVEAAAEALSRLNPHVAVTPVLGRIGAGDVDLVAAHDLVLDGTDSFASRQAINAACVAAGVPLLAGSIAQWEGQLALYDPTHGGACLACLFPEPPAAGLALPCAEAGVVGALPGVIGSMMALEAIKHLAGVSDGRTGSSLRGRMVIFDGLWGDTRSVTIPRRIDCAVCGGITGL